MPRRTRRTKQRIKRPARTRIPNHALGSAPRPDPGNRRKRNDGGQGTGDEVEGRKIRIRAVLASDGKT
eukprot:scaffold47736_cov35-Tisochrysis_lutea.AAC.4